ncbi:hypothetical protein SARC_06237 [Sphaeroforma arctica JP610]|uniref:Endonuclease n=1 Tax=Sphaeroforma arctica JP610 TaxID=667725 RepID=A0A0L0FZQ1_9EUKA|nr:hypothetical protein SARC_06237 [Sphaeroforma arctica JP610]KNC81448.1 hypothetical protein SARC_06237 [Sphaeroforma arctica JP610]|eukprot:XP_014155350.1 hypothetical protein SARC_06237 [Sphaeroforma arctica JP610]
MFHDVDYRVVLVGGAGTTYVVLEQKHKDVLNRERHTSRYQMSQLQEQLQRQLQISRANVPIAPANRVQPPTPAAAPGAEVATPPPYDIMKYGFPSLENVRYREGHVLSYDNRNKTANWVCEKFTAQHLNAKAADRKKTQFFEDQEIYELWRAKLSDYKRSGYDRGHLAAAGNHKYYQKAMDATFSLSNMSPQVGKGFNQGYWKELEDYVRDLTKTSTNVYVCTGPLYLPNEVRNGKKYVRFEVIGEGNVAVPTHFFKTMLCEKNDGSVAIEAYILPNEVIDSKIPLKQFRVPLHKVEAAAGGLLYPGLLDKYKYVVA